MQLFQVLDSVNLLFVLNDFHARIGKKLNQPTAATTVTGVATANALQ